VRSTNELVALDPVQLAVVGRCPLPGVEGACGIALDPGTQTAFVAGEKNATVCAFEVKRSKIRAVSQAGRDVDVLANDESTHRLFMPSESGVVSVFDATGGRLRKLAEGFFAPNAHAVGVDPASHSLYFPLMDVGGRPPLRTARYTGT